MADTQALEILRKSAAQWNRWRGSSAFRPVDLTHADLSGMKLNEYSFLRADLSGANLTRTQLEHAHLKNANLAGAVLSHANLESVNAREATFDHVTADHANFEVATLRGATFRNATLTEARFHRAYLRDTDLSGANLTRAWLRFATLDHARCRKAVFAGADLRYAAMVRADISGADLTNVQVFGISAWDVRTDTDTRQDLIVSTGDKNGDAVLRAHDLQTAQLLALMLDGSGVRQVLDSVNSKLVLILGSFASTDKPALDALRTALQARGYVAVTFDFERPSEHDYGETICTLGGMSRFVVADFTNAKEVRAEVPQIRSQYKRVPVIPIARAGAILPDTMLNVFDVEELKRLVRYADIDDLLSKVAASIVEPAESQAKAIAARLAEAAALLAGK